MSFSDNLKQIRKEKNLSQEDLAELLDVSRQAVSKWEQGAGYPEVEKLLIMSERLNVSLDKLMDSEINTEQHEQNNDINESGDSTKIPNLNNASDSAPLPETPPAVSSSAPTKKKNKTAAAIVSVIAALLLCAAIVFVIIETVGTKEAVTDANGEKIRGGFGYTEMSVKDTDGTVRTIKTDRSLISPQEILDKYTKVMNNLKDEAPGFTKIRYQNLPTENQSFGSIGKIVLPIIEKFVTSKAVSEPVTYTAGNASQLPVIGSPYGCLLTDETKIENSYCEVLEDGNYKLVITLADEMNPEVLSSGATSSSSAVSSIFDPYSVINEITSISEIAMHDISFNYTDCTVTLIYDKKTQNVISVNMTMNIEITAQTLLTPLNVEIVDITEYTDFIY